MKASQPFLLLGVAFGLLGSVYAQQSTRINSQFEDFKGDGYYWYRQDPEPVKPKVEPIKPPQPAAATPAKEEVKPLSAAWMRSNMPKLLDTAVDNPTKENVSNYMYAQRVLLDKSQNFSEKVKEVVGTDPFLDENNRVPIAQFAQIQFMRAADADREKVMAHIATKAGIWVFLDAPDKCSACEQYVSNVLLGANGVPGMVPKFNFEFKKIYVNTPEGRAAAKKLNLKVTPTTVLAIPPTGYYLVSQGLMAKDTLQERILLSAKTSGLLTKDLEEKINPYGKGVLSTDEINAGLEGGDATEVMKTLRQRIKGE